MHTNKMKENDAIENTVSKSYVVRQIFHIYSLDTISNIHSFIRVSKDIKYGNIVFKYYKSLRDLLKNLAKLKRNVKFYKYLFLVAVLRMI